MYNVYFMDTFVVEVFVASITMLVDGPAVTFKGFLPLPLARSIVSSTASSARAVLSMSSHSCLAMASTGKNKRPTGVILADGSILCDSTMKTPTALRGNMTLQLNMLCSEALMPRTCDPGSLLSEASIGIVQVNNTWLFQLYDRMIRPISETRACADAALDSLPQRQTIGFTYSSVTSAERSSTSSSTNAWCTSAQYVAASKKIHDDFWTNVLSRKMAQRNNKNEIQTLWKQCFLSCDSRRKGKVWELKMAACLELLHNAPFTIGGELKSNNTAQIMPRGSKFASLVCPNVSIAALETGSVRTRRAADLLPGTGPTTCITSTEIYQIMVFNFDREYAPVKDQPTKELLFPETRNPTPIFQHLQSLYSMHVTGEVTVWSTHKEFSKLTGSQGPLKELLLYNQNVTLVRIMVESPQVGSFLSKLLPQFLINLITEPKPCTYYIDKIETALLPWRGVSCPKLSRAQMLPDNKGEIAPYVVHVIDQNYNGWGGGTKKTGILSTCSI